MSESEIQKKIIKYLSSIQAYYVKIVKATKSGVPDIICCINGYFFAFEVKAKTGVVAPLQEYNIRKIHSSGGFGGIVRSVEDVKDIIKSSGV